MCIRNADRKEQKGIQCVFLVFSFKQIAGNSQVHLGICKKQVTGQKDDGIYKTAVLRARCKRVINNVHDHHCAPKRNVLDHPFVRYFFELYQAVIKLLIHLAESPTDYDL